MSAHLAAFSSMSLSIPKIEPPRAKKQHHVVYFGVTGNKNENGDENALKIMTMNDIENENKNENGNENENEKDDENENEEEDSDDNLPSFRGDNPMDPPRERSDWYFWLRDDTRKRPDVLEYLEAENTYFQLQTAHLLPLQDKLYSEMLSHLKETDEDFSHKHGPYNYYSKTKEGFPYKIHCRSFISSSESVSKEQIVLDENELAKGQSYSDVSSISVSPSHRLLAYGQDKNGYETYNLIVQTIGDEEAEKTELVNIPETNGDVEWGNDDSTLFYLKVNELSG